MKPVTDFGRFFVARGFELHINARGPQAFEFETLRLVSCFRPGSKERIKIRWVKECVDNENLAPQFGQAHGEALIASGQIPVGWLPFNILLPGTVWKGTKRRRNYPCYMPVMFFSIRDDVWKIGLTEFGNHITPEGQYSNYRLIRFVSREALLESL